VPVASAKSLSASTPSSTLRANAVTPRPPTLDTNPEAARAALEADRVARGRAASEAVAKALTEHRCTFVVNLRAEWDIQTGTTRHIPVVAIEPLD